MRTRSRVRTLRGSRIDRAARWAQDRCQKSLTVKGLASGAVTGAGVTSGAKLVVPGTETCTLQGTTYTQTSTAYNEASWKSSTQFVAKTILTGTLKAATTGSGEFVNITLKK